MRFSFISLFSETLAAYLNASMMYKAQHLGLAQFEFINLREFGIGPHKSVDDTIYGGGDGMLLRCEPVFAAVESIKADSPRAKVIIPTPAGQLWSQTLAQQFAGVAPDSDSARIEHLIIICPRYEGFDERILSLVDYPISLGQYILTGGELPALIITDSIVRLIPGVLGGATSASIESFSAGDNLEFPQYTKPAEFRGMRVPEILLSGNHGAIDQWRAEQARQRTEQARRQQL